MSAEPKKTDNKIAKRVGYGLGIPVLLGIAGVGIAFWSYLASLNKLTQENGAAPGTTVRTTGDIIARTHTFGPIGINQYKWLICPTVNPAHQNMYIHIVEDDVWVDYIIDGAFYRDLPRCLPDHKDIKICKGSIYRVRVTPGTAVRTATVMVTISEY